MKYLRIYNMVLYNNWSFPAIRNKKKTELEVAYIFYSKFSISSKKQLFKEELQFQHAECEKKKSEKD